MYSSIEPPDADPHVRWCGRRGIVRCPPIPILPSLAAAGVAALSRAEPYGLGRAGLKILAILRGVHDGQDEYPLAVHVVVNDVRIVDDHQSPDVLFFGSTSLVRPDF